MWLFKENMKTQQLKHEESSLDTGKNPINRILRVKKKTLNGTLREVRIG